MRTALLLAITMALLGLSSTTLISQTVVSQHLLLVDPTTGHMIKLQVPGLSGPLTLNLPTSSGTLITTANGWALGGNDLSLAGPLQNQIGSTSASMTDVDLIAGGDIKLRVGATTGLVSLLDATGLAFQDDDETNVSTFTAGDQAADINYTLPTTQPAANDVLAATAVSGTGPYAVTLGWTAGSDATFAALATDLSTVDEGAYTEVTDLAMTVAANTNYQVTLLWFSDNTVGGENSDLRFTFPSGTITFAADVQTVEPSQYVVNSGSPATVTNLNSNTNARTIRVNGILSVGATAGTLRTLFKLNGADNGTNTVTFRAGSHIILRKL